MNRSDPAENASDSRPDSGSDSGSDSAARRHIGGRHIGEQIAGCLAVLAVALIGLIYFHYRLEWRGLAGVVVETSRADIMWVFGIAALLSLLALFWIIHRQTRRRSDFHRARARRAEDALSRLRATIHNTWADAEHATDHATDQGQMRQWQAGNEAQIAELNRITGEIAGLADAMGGIHQSAAQSADHARRIKATANHGAVAVKNAIAGINDTDKRIQSAADQLQRLAQNARQFSQSAQAIREITAQTNVLSLNAALRAGAADHAEATETAEEMRRLADRATRAATAAAEQSRAIQSNADDSIAALKITTDQGAATHANEAARALAEIETTTRENLERLNQIATSATVEAAHAKTIREKTTQLKHAAEQSAVNATRLVDGLEKLQEEADVKQAVAGNESLEG